MRTHKHAVRATAFFLTILFLFACCSVAASAAPVRRLGDVNSDGTVNAFDYMLMKRFVLGTYCPSVIDYMVWDINADGRINAIDYMLLKRTVLGTFKLPDPPVTTNEPPLPDEYDQECLLMLDAVNAARRENGKDPLVYRWDLQQAADIRAQEIITKFDHTRPNGEPFHSAIYQLGVYGFCAEVLTEGEFNANTAVALWMGSDKGHRSILLFSTMTGMVAGHTTVGKMNYWVALFVEEPYNP